MWVKKVVAYVRAWGEWGTSHLISSRVDLFSWLNPFRHIMHRSSWKKDKRWKLHFPLRRVSWRKKKISLTVENGRDKVTFLLLPTVSRCCHKPRFGFPFLLFDLFRLSFSFLPQLLPSAGWLSNCVASSFCIDNLAPKGIVQTNEIDFMRLEGRKLSDVLRERESKKVQQQKMRCFSLALDCYFFLARPITHIASPFTYTQTQQARRILFGKIIRTETITPANEGRKPPPSLALSSSFFLHLLHKNMDCAHLL